jgi:hypothetical protein
MKNIVNGKLQYKSQNYKVLNTLLSDEIVKKLEEYHGEKKWVDPTAPWKTMPLLLVLEGDKLYLTKLYVDGLLEELMGSDKIFASWIDKLELLLEDKTICKTYEQKDSYLNEQTRLYLSFDKGVFLTEKKQTELYRDIEPKNNIDQYLAYTTFRINSNDLLIYLEDDMQVEEDQLLPIFSIFINEMLEENDDGISLDMSDLKEVLQKGDVALFSSAKGRDIEKIVNSLISSVTNEYLLNPKGCLMNLMVNRKYPRKSILTIIKDIDVGLKFNFEPLEPNMKVPFYVGTRYIDKMDEDEVLIMILVSI